MFRRASCTEDATLHAIIGEAHLRQGSFAKAAEHLDKAVAGTPATASARSAIGLVPFVSFDRSRSLADVERALVATRDYAEPHRLLAIAHLQAGKYDQALKSIAVLEKDHPREPDLLSLKGTALVGKKDYVAGRAALEAALAIDPDHAPAMVKLAHLDIAEGRPEQGRQRIAAFLARYPRNAEALVGVAAIGPMLGAKDSEIVGWLERAREIRPRETQILMMLMAMHLRMNEQAKVAAIAAELAKYGSDRTDVKWVLGIAQLETGDAAAAVSTFSALLSAQPESPEVMRMLAESVLRASNYVSTAHPTMLLTKALALKPDYVEALMALVEIDVRAKRLPQALKRVREARRIAPDSGQTYVLEGDILMLQGQAAAAARAYENAFARQRAGSTTIRMHDALDQLGKPIEADSILRHWFEEQPADVSVRIYYGNHLLQRKKYREAASEYERVLTRNPNDPDVLNNYAWVLDQIDDPRAKSVAERANAARPNSAAALDTIGVILIKRGDFEQGIDALQRALTLAPEAGEVRYHLAQAWLKAGNRAKAVRELEVLIAHYPQFSERDEAEKLLKELNR
jgi:putative PEP-CTERM system TPR-repeat lipoprotein